PRILDHTLAKTTPSKLSAENPFISKKKPCPRRWLPRRPRTRRASSWCTARATAGGAGTGSPRCSAPRATAWTRWTSRPRASTPGGFATCPPSRTTRAPLLDALQALPPGERAVLVGHSFGGMNIALAAEMFPEKVAAAVFVTAFLPDCTNPRSHPIEKLTLTDWMDSTTDVEHVPSLVFLGPEFLRQKLYQLSPPEDYTLSQSLARVSSYYVADLQSQPPFREDRYGAVSKVYIICEQDQAMLEAYQRAMIAGCPVKEVKEIANADHWQVAEPGFTQVPGRVLTIKSCRKKKS
ncbi:hypothetical protein BS78_03G165100, partial [Paspalum vaginatum]